MRHMIRGDQQVEEVLAKNGTVGKAILDALGEAIRSQHSSFSTGWLYEVQRGWIYDPCSDQKRHIELRLKEDPMPGRKTLVIREVEGDQFMGKAVWQNGVLVVEVGKDLSSHRIPGIARQLFTRFVMYEPPRKRPNGKGTKVATSKSTRSLENAGWGFLW